MPPERLKREEGFTLIELLVAMGVGLVVLGTAFAVLQSSSTQQIRQSDRAAQAQDARVMVERITREVRQGSDVVVANPATLSLVTWVNSATCGGGSDSSSIECRVTYSCGGGTCTREETDVGTAAGGSGEQIVDGLGSSSVFTYLPDTSDPSFVEVKLELSEDGAESVTVEGGVTLRNSVTS